MVNPNLSKQFLSLIENTQDIHEGGNNEFSRILWIAEWGMFIRYGYPRSIPLDNSSRYKISYDGYKWEEKFIHKHANPNQGSFIDTMGYSKELGKLVASVYYREGSFICTSDNGVDWTQLYSSPFKNDMEVDTEITWVDELGIFFGVWGGRVYISTASGNDWGKLDLNIGYKLDILRSEIYLSSVYWDPLLKSFVGLPSYNRSGTDKSWYLLSSVDGENWNKIYIADNHPLWGDTSLVYTPQSKFFINGYGQKIHELVNFTGELSDIVFLESDLQPKDKNGGFFRGDQDYRDYTFFRYEPELGVCWGYQQEGSIAVTQNFKSWVHLDLRRGSNISPNFDSIKEGFNGGFCYSPELRMVLIDGISNLHIINV